MLSCFCFVYFFNFLNICKNVFSVFVPIFWILQAAEWKCNFVIINEIRKWKLKKKQMGLKYSYFFFFRVCYMGIDVFFFYKDCVYFFNLGECMTHDKKKYTRGIEDPVWFITLVRLVDWFHL